MGNKCSALRRGTDPGQGIHSSDQPKDEESNAVISGEDSPLMQREPSFQEEVKDEKTSGKETCGQAEDVYLESSNYCAKSGLENTTTEVTLSSSEPMSITEEEQNTNWIESNRPELIQSIHLVMPIADQLLKRNMLHKEMYDQIRTTSTSQDQMRKLFGALNSVKAKAAFYEILRETQPEICQNDDTIREIVKRNKDFLRKMCKWEREGTEEDNKTKSLYQIYTELHIVQGENEHVNKQHEIWQIEDKFRNQATEGIKINCNNIFQSAPEMRAIRTVMTKGIAGIGKTVSVKKFILDWADGKANPDLDFIFMIPFRELNLVKDDEFSLETLVKEFHPELKNIAVAENFDKYKVLFIFDGLDESQLKLNFLKTKRLTDPTKVTSVDILVTNLIREHLLPSALVWITSRPGAIQRIPKKHIYQWTEVRGFNDPQKILYFKNRVQNKMVAEKIIDHIKNSRSLFIMCHIPIFCWIASEVLEYMLLKMENSLEKTTKIPTTLMEMYTHFFCTQMKTAAKKYGKEDKLDAAEDNRSNEDKENELDITELFRLNEDFIFKLGRMAFEKLNKGEIIFSKDDLKCYDIDIEKAGVCCGLCTAIFKEESIFHSKKLYCFVHLTIQEYFAALFVYRSFASKTIDSQSLRDFLLIGSEEELKTILDVHPVDLPLDELLEIAIANSTLRKTGELDMFLRFLIGMSLESTQNQLQGLIQQTEKHSEVAETIRTCLEEMDLNDCSPDRCMNLVHCLAELKDDSLYDSVKTFLNPNQYPETELTPVQCSALADLMLMSTTPIEEFDLAKYTTKIKGTFRIIPAVRNCRKARISGVILNSALCEVILSALRSPQSPLTELDLTKNRLWGDDFEIFIGGLKNAECKLEVFSLSLSASGMSEESTKNLASALKPMIPNLRELELSENILMDSLLTVIADGLRCRKLEKLRLNQNSNITEICKEIATSFSSHSSNLQELELSYTNFKDSEMEILSAGLMSDSCILETLRISHNKLTAEGCETLASVLSSRPSPLRELDLSYNDLHDAGVMKLCKALVKPNCTLEKLRLSFCKVKEDGCSSLASALMSDHCCLRELDLSFNYLTDHGAKMLSEKQKDPHCRLECLNVDHNEEFWVNLKLLRQYACDLTLDINTAGAAIMLTKNNKMASYCDEKLTYPHHPERFGTSQVLCIEGLTGRHYWEAECYMSSDTDVGVAYKSIPRQGDCSSEISLTGNEKAWSWNTTGCFYHNNYCQTFLKSDTCSIGIYLDWPAGVLSFFDVSRDAVTHLYTVHTAFTEPLHPGFGLISGSVCIKEKNIYR